MVANLRSPLEDLVRDLLDQVGPAHYQRSDLRLHRPVPKDLMTRLLIEQTPPEIGGERVEQVESLDGVKIILADDSWLLIRPSGTEPVLRVYAEGRSPEMVQALLGFGEQVARQTA
jgi:phosphomannomutase